MHEALTSLSGNKYSVGMKWGNGENGMAVYVIFSTGLWSAWLLNAKMTVLLCNTGQFLSKSAHYSRWNVKTKRQLCLSENKDSRSPRKPRPQLWISMTSSAISVGQDCSNHIILLAILNIFAMMNDTNQRPKQNRRSELDFSLSLLCNCKVKLCTDWLTADGIYSICI